MMSTQQSDWKVLLIGGPSGVGKTIVARLIGQRLGVPWLEVDDLRLSLQRSRVILPENTAALYFFEEAPDVWRLPSEQLRDGLISVAEIMSPAIEVVIENHVDNAAPIIIEGDGIVSSLFARPPVQARASGGQARAVFLIESDEEVILANMLARGRGIDRQSEAEQCTEARTKWLYGQWLAGEARRYNLPVLEPRPWTTLVERIIEAIGE